MVNARDVEKKDAIVTETHVDYATVRRLQAQVADRMTAAQNEADAFGGGRPRSRLDEQQQAMSFIADAVSRYNAEQLATGHELLPEETDASLRAAVFAAIFGAGELQGLLDDDRVENVDINGCDEVWVSYADQKDPVRVDPVCETDDELISIVATLAEYSGINARPWNMAHPELDLRLPDGSRLSAVMGAARRPSVSIRRNRFKRSVFLADLVANGTISQQLADFLAACVRARRNIVIAGGTDAGKTTLLRAILNCIEPWERLVTVERALEIGLSDHPELHPNVTELEEMLPDSDGQGGVGMQKLVIRSRRMNPDRVIVGEVIGPEVAEMLSAMSQGNEGSLTTLHARSVTQVIRKLAEYMGTHTGFGWAEANDLIADAVDVIVYIRKNPLHNSIDPKRTNTRCVSDVIEVSAGEHGQVNTLALFQSSPVDGTAIRTMHPSDFADELAAAGYDDGHYGPPAGYLDGV